MKNEETLLLLNQSSRSIRKKKTPMTEYIWFRPSLA
jgi:hypothetical protein